MTVESRKRPYDEIELEQDDANEFEIEGSDEDIDVDDFLTQKIHFAKSRRARHYVKMSQMQQSSSGADPDKVAGVIRRVSLKNFMCHENFVLEFGPRLNFIIGHNGSGKSAILTGISICLGAKASETNRGSSLKDLIKEGTSSSHIQVVLANEGPDAYEPGKYGSEIIIERTLKRDGTATPYVLKSENGTRVSAKKADLDAILDYHNIAVNNPMAFLSQDAARSFLTASTDEQKYKFFMRGTLMDEIYQNLKTSKEQVDNMGLRIIRMKEALMALKDEARKAKKLHERLRSSEELRQRQRILHGKYFWMQADKATKVVNEVKQSHSEMQETIEQLGNMINDYETKISSVDSDKEDLTLKQKNVEELSRAETERFGSKKKEMQLVSSKIDGVVLRLQEVEKSIKDNEQRIVTFNRNIQREEERIKEINGGSLEALRNELSVLEEHAKEVERQKQEVSESLDSVDSRNKEVYNDLQMQQNDKRQIIQNLQQFIRILKSNKNDELAAYPDKIKAVVSEVSRSSFQAPVLGPVGRYLSLKPKFEKWGPVLEQHIGPNLNTFIVETFRDQRTLKGIFRKHNLFSNIIVRKPEQFNYSSGVPSNEFTSVLDVLNFSDENIKYALIDMAHIESVIIMEDRVQAQHVLEARTQNVNQVISLNDRHSGQRSSINRNGGFRVDPLYYDTNIPKLKQKNRVQDLNTFENRLKDEQQQLASLDGQKNQLSQNARAEKAHLSDRRKNLDIEGKRLQSQIYQINSKLEDYADTGKLEGFIEDRDAAKRENEAYRNTIGEIHQEIETLKEKLQLKVQESEVIKVLAREAHLELKDIQKKILNLSAEKQLNISKKKHFEETMRKRIEDHEAMTQNLPAWESNIQENILQAEESCQREEADSIRLHSIDEVKNAIEKVTRRVEQANEALGKSPENIINEDEAARNKYIDAKTQFDSAVANRKLFHSSHNDRLKAFRESRAATFFEADLDFKLSLQFRNFSGNLDFDTTKDKLTMYVSTKNDKNPRHVDSLSGGEKSFSQISLLLATWKPMRSRIKGLDEFDVFMDQVNRKIGMRLMLDKLSKEHSQTIFITPQDIGQIADLDEKYVRIHRIRDPRTKL